MITRDDTIQGYLSSIYDEIMRLSFQVGECKSSIEHLDNLIVRYHQEERRESEELKTRIGYVEEKERAREKRSVFLIQFFQLSFTNVLKWCAILTTVLFFVAPYVHISIETIKNDIEWAVSK